MPIVKLKTTKRRKRGDRSEKESESIDGGVNERVRLARRKKNEKSKNRELEGEKCSKILNAFLNDVRPRRTKINRPLANK